MLRLSRTLNTLLALQESLDSQKHTDFFGSRTSHCTAGYPGVNIFKKGEELTLSIELPGTHKDDLKIEVKGRNLRIAGKRSIEYGEGVSLHRAERLHTSFDRSLSLPFRVNEEVIKATYEDGLLLITLEQAEADKPKQVTIQ